MVKRVNRSNPDDLVLQQWFEHGADVLPVVPRETKPGTLVYEIGNPAQVVFAGKNPVIGGAAIVVCPYTGEPHNTGFDRLRLAGTKGNNHG